MYSLWERPQEAEEAAAAVSFLTFRKHHQKVAEAEEAAAAVSLLIFLVSGNTKKYYGVSSFECISSQGSRRSRNKLHLNSTGDSLWNYTKTVEIFRKYFLHNF